MMTKGTRNGLATCEEALQRLVSGKPHRPEHVGLDLSKLTAGIVSYEAGFDRGYLKKARKSHQALIAQIEAYRHRAPVSSVKARELVVVAEKLSTSRGELDEALKQRDNMLTRNLQLMLRIKALEKEITQLRKSSASKVVAFSERG
ncbi:hypothetical protein [Pseudomonas sp. 5Ae-yellow]|uniref:hypothetical protein n=1 Tax=Pseudomonas sp. 5Ae-yellow TaxID=2759848 RepID=UPI0015F72FA1|nr:hypothetical protein [Pseudomonas sp. 5Ae-yellow]MBA6419611.1 hypothetical protein [Pseudomonas sp. 5Ae-yellow]